MSTKSNLYDNSQAEQLFNIKKNVLTMMQARGYDISAERPLLDYKLKDFLTYYNQVASSSKSTFKQSLSFGYNKITNDEKERDYVYVYFPETIKDSGELKNMNQEQAKQIITAIHANNITHVIIIIEVGMTSGVMDTFKDMPSIRFETFLYEELAINPTEHVSVPKHTLLSEQEAKDFLVRNKIKNKLKLPKLSIYDPIARYYGYTIGQIIQIDRENLYHTSTVDSYRTYRVVVDIDLNKSKSNKK